MSASGMRSNRKFQVSNGYLFEFSQLARVLNHLLGHRSSAKIRREELEESTGLSNRQLESLVSIGCAVGLIVPGRQTLTPTGALIATHDGFLEAKGTLEWCHYRGAGNYHNLIWYEIFNTILPGGTRLTQDGWVALFRNNLSGQYTDRTIGKHLYEEVRFVVDAYVERHFGRLSLLHRDSRGVLYRRRYIDVDPLIAAAMLYDVGDSNQTKLLQLNDVLNKNGHAGYLFGMDDTTVRKIAENLDESGWVRYESTHNLDQIRLKPGYDAVAFLSAYYEGRGPSSVPESTSTEGMSNG